MMREMWGTNSVVASDVKSPPRSFFDSGPFQYVDVVDRDQLARVILENGIDVVVHLASMLSAIGERNPQLALKVNNAGIENVLELARINNLRVFAPSTIAVFGPTTPKDNTPDDTIMRPTTMYGLTKVFGAASRTTTRGRSRSIGIASKSFSGSVTSRSAAAESASTPLLPLRFTSVPEPQVN